MNTNIEDRDIFYERQKFQYLKDEQHKGDVVGSSYNWIFSVMNLIHSNCEVKQKSDTVKSAVNS